MTRLHKSDGMGRIRFEDAAPPVTQEFVTTTVSAALANLLSKDLPLAFKPFNDQFATITETLKTLTPAKKEDVAPPIAGASPELQSALLESKRAQEKLKADLDVLTNENKASKAKAATAEQNSAISQELSNYQFASPKAAENAFKLINMEVKRSDDGTLVAGENLTVAAFVKDFLTVQNDHFLKGIDTAGTGASKGQRGSNATVTLEDIGPGMTPEKRAAVLAAIQAARQ